MKKIGEQFKNKREEIGISISEVASDLKIDAIIIENLEDGNDKVFKDIIELKDIFALYARYLGLDEDKILSDIDDYFFEKTSKITMNDIKEITQNTKVNSEKKVKSPYTISNTTEKSSNTYVLLIVIVVVLIILLIIFFILKEFFMG